MGLCAILKRKNTVITRYIVALSFPTLFFLCDYLSSLYSINLKGSRDYLSKFEGVYVSRKYGNHAVMWCTA